MKKTTLVKLLCVLVVAMMVATVAGAAGFSKTATYAEGTFTDVKSTSWYAKEVVSAYELGFMNGKAEGQFAPDGNVTVAEAITMASRVHSIYSGKEIAKTEGKWYDMYVQYALANGIIAEGQFTNFDRNIMRYEMAVMFADAMPESYFEAKNNVKEIPDVNAAEEYHDKLMMLYNAGVVMGSTEYGDFLATNSIKRSETAAIINRVALPENRLSKTISEYGDREQAVFLIDDYDMEREVRGVRMLTSGWDYENTANPARDTSGSTTNSLADSSKESFVAIHRPIFAQNSGVLEVETIFTPNADSGARIYFSDSEGNVMFELRTVNGKYFAIGEAQVDTGTSAVVGNNNLYFELDIDNKKAKVVLGGKEIGTFDMSKKVSEISKMSIATTKEDELLIGVAEVHMYKNYDVMDMFRLDAAGSAPYGWTVNNASVEINAGCSTDTNSAKIAGSGSASTTFDKVSGKFVYETFVLVPASQTVSLSLKNGNETAVKVDASSNKFELNGAKIRDFNSNVWQLVRVEGDTDKNTAVIKINGKKVADVALSADSIDGIEVEASGTGDLWFDDVKLYNVFDYADYVPTPVPVVDDGYYVGMSSCSLWHEGTHYGWDLIAPFDSHTPVLGYYDEGLPEVADWEIKFQVEHGYDFQQYCWFVANQNVAMKEPRLSDALHDGYFNAKYSDMEKFAIMWENSGSKLVTFDFFKNYIWTYWVDWYLTDSRYMTIENKPYINLYRYDSFVEQMGSVENAKAAIEFMDAECKKLGFDGVITMFCNNLANATVAKDIKSIGADAVVSYTLGEMSYDAQYQKDGMNKYFSLGEVGGVTFLPSVGVGFNDIGWNGGRTPLATAEAHEDVFRWAKDTYLPGVAKRETDDAWMSKFVLATTWNEFGEGHFIFPTNVNKFGYVDGTRATFSIVAGTDDKAHFDIEPTLSQKSRLGYLYPAENAPMKRLYLLEDASGTTGEDYSKNIPVLTWDFEKNGEELVKNWQGWNSKEISKMEYSASEKAFNITTTGNDPSIRWNPASEIGLNADNGKILHIQMKASAGATSSFELFWMNPTDTTYSGAKGSSFKVLGNGEYNDYYLDLSSKSTWSGTISSLRLDPIGEPSDVYIKKIEFLSDKIEGATTLIVDGASFEYTELFAKKVGDELYIAGDPSNGFYSLLNLYYEWNRWDGKLLVKTNDGTTINFTVGSDKVIVNGKEETISEKISVVDGLVMVPFKFICEKAGYEVKEDNGTYNVTVREGLAEELEAASKKENWFEFNTTGDTQGWIVNNGQGSVLNGIFAFSASPVTGSGTGYDPSIAHKALNVATAYYKTVECRLKPTFDDPDLEFDMSKIYFATDVDGSLSESKTLRWYLSDYEPDAQGYYTVTIDASANENWRGSVNQVRFDPSNYGGYYEIDYIRFIADPAYEAELEAVEKAAAEANKNMYAVDDGAPFFIQNADAELTTSTANLAKNITIKEDDLIPGNHAYYVTPTTTTAKNWVYFIAPTRFKPGATYKVSFDARVICDHLGNPATDALLSWNMRYAEMVDGALKSTVDHYASFREQKLSTDDGWQHFEFEVTIKDDIADARQYDKFTLFMDPGAGGPEGFLNYTYMVDNIKVEAIG